MAFDIQLRNPGSQFNIDLASAAVAFLIGAFWGIKVTIV